MQGCGKYSIYYVEFISQWVEESRCSVNGHYYLNIDVNLIFRHNIPNDSTV